MTVELLSRPIWWTVTLADGAVVRVFADCYGEQGDEIVFSNQYKSSGALDEDFTVDEGSERGGWCLARVAEFPRAGVRSVLTADANLESVGPARDARRRHRAGTPTGRSASSSPPRSGSGKTTASGPAGQ